MQNNNYSHRKFNETQTSLDPESLSALIEELNIPEEYQQELIHNFLDVLDSIEFVQNLTSPNRPRLKDLKRWDDPYSKDRVLDPTGRIEVNLTNPHILEDMDWFRKPVLNYLETGSFTNTYPNRLPNSEYMKFWKRQAEICRTYIVRPSDGEWIPGKLYWYWNFFPIYKTIKKKGKKKSDRIFTNPDMYDGDYLYHHYKYRAREHGQHTTTLKARGKGFPQPNSEMVLTDSGFKFLGEITLEDKLAGARGEFNEIKEIYDHPNRELYKITLKDGRYVRCAIDHLWKIHTYKGKEKIVETSYFLDKRLKIGRKGKEYYKFHLPQIEPIEYPKKNFNIDPYTLGCLIGDGSWKKGVRISSNDEEIINELIRLNPDYKITKDKYDKYRYNFTSKDRTYSRIIRELKRLDLYNCNVYSKFIPEEYFFGSVEERMELVRGLLDTDGTSSPNGSIRFTNTSERLIDETCTLLRSLGIIAKKSKTVQEGKKVKFPNGYESIQKDCWIISIITDKEVFKLKRKLKNVKSRKYNLNKIAITSIEKLQYKEDCRCVLVDSEDHLYITEDYILTHNSFKGGSDLACNIVLGDSLEATTGVKSYAIADEKEYLTKDGVLNKFIDGIDFIAEHSPFPRARDVKDSMNEMNWRMSYKDKNGREKGVKNEVMGVTLKNDPQKARGKRGALIKWEEVGRMPHAVTAWIIARPSVEDDDGSAFGQMDAYGTGGTEEADFAGLEQFFYSPQVHNIHSIPNVFDKNANSKSEVAFFFPIYLNLKSCYDESGNSDVVKSLFIVLAQRLMQLKNSADPNAIIQMIAEKPITPQESILRVEGSIFPVTHIRAYIEEIKSDLSSFISPHFVGDLVTESSTNKIKWRLEPTKKPIREYPLKGVTSKEGAVEIFVHPLTDGEGKVPHWRYIAGIDPFDDDHSTTNSLGSIFIFDLIEDKIVAEYTGRPNSAIEFYDICYSLIKYYNATCNYENDKKGFFGYMSNRNSLHMLCDTPSHLKSMQYVKGTLRGNKAKGTPSGKLINAYGRALQRDWQLKPSVNEPDKNNVYRIRSLGYLEECLKWNIELNCDRISAMNMVMILREERLKNLDAMFDGKDNEDSLANDSFFTRHRNRKLKK